MEVCFNINLNLKFISNKYFYQRLIEELKFDLIQKYIQNDRNKIKIMDFINSIEIVYIKRKTNPEVHNLFDILNTNIFFYDLSSEEIGVLPNKIDSIESKFKINEDKSQLQDIMQNLLNNYFNEKIKVIKNLKIIRRNLLENF